MLSYEDKKWIKDVILEGRQEDRDWVKKQLDDICLVMAEGFAQTASATQLNQLDARVGSIEQRLKYVEENMVTMDYLDRHLDDLKERQSTQIQHLKIGQVSLLKELKNKGIIAPKRANAIASLSPFPHKV